MVHSVASGRYGFQHWNVDLIVDCGELVCDVNSKSGFRSIEKD